MLQTPKNALFKLDNFLHLYLTSYYSTKMLVGSLNSNDLHTWGYWANVNYIPQPYNFAMEKNAPIFSQISKTVEAEYLGLANLLLFLNSLNATKIGQFSCK